ncbi:DUF3800 domain-containing protein [Methylobacterium bullatum]|uniref:DUF3800 domain-containing protein n=1 Tax=Methylobacterium bullatum TaxID=570505 RepID=A0A679K051_9HYPH|nr:hypothetical protein MBLL_00774 [Methylobacterium bullatum]
MFIYADETGNSGKNIFDKNEWYRLGSIMSVSDIENSMGQIIRPFCDVNNIERVHAHELPLHKILEISTGIISALSTAGAWQFYSFSIHKPYMATSKFVDTVFDSGENAAVPAMWYNLELFRHALCCAVDLCMTPLNRERFWNSFIKDDVQGIHACVRTLDNYVLRYVLDPRMREVMRDAFRFVLKHPEEFTLTAAEKRQSYQGHTPNMVAFTSLFNEIHLFADANNSPPIAFIHDQQQEFKKAMKKAYETFGPVRTDEHPMGAIPEVSHSTYDLATFSMPSSKESYALQATDILLWIIQRNSTSSDFAQIAG